MDSLESRTLAKVSARFLPLLVVCYFVAYLDRVNISFAALTMRADLGLSATAYGFGAGVFFLAYFVFEIPSNLLLAHFGARKWIARIMFSWGLLSGAMAFVSGPNSFYLLRSLLGIAEAGFFPGIIFFLTLWYPASYRARIMGYFIAAGPLSNVIGAPVSALLLQLEGWMGLKGWQWLFIVEAVPALILAVVVFRHLTDRPADAAWLDMDERTWLINRLDQEQQQKESHKKYSLIQALVNPKVHAITFVYFGMLATLYAMTFFLPQIVQGFGMSNLQTGVITALPYIIGTVSVVLWGRRSDLKLERRYHLVFALLVAVTATVATTISENPIVKMLAFSIAAFGIYGSLSVFWTLPTAFLSGAAAAGGIALINSIGNLAGFAGPYAMGWIKDASGSYTGGLLLSASLGFMAMLVVLVLKHDQSLEQVPPSDNNNNNQQEAAMNSPIVRNQVGMLTGLLLGWCLSTFALAQSTQDLLVSVSNGQLSGSSQEGIKVFKGIPYGASTAGEYRFKLARPAPAWQGIRAARDFGPECPQMMVSGAPKSTAPSSEDCLSLNVWTPGTGDGGKRPVMVWLHGGGFSVGSGASPVFDGKRLAQKGDTVIVTLNHRLNFFGYLYLTDVGGPEFADSGNLGQLDIVLALQWLKHNISAFGGDPDNVTIFGESGGGSKVGTLLATKEADGLFHKGILESGYGLTAILPADAAAMRDKLFTLLALKRGDVTGLQKKSVEQIQEAMSVVTGGSPYGVGPVLDGRSVPRHPFTPDAPAMARNIPVIAGYNKDETTALFAPPDTFTLDWAGLEGYLHMLFPATTNVPALLAELRRLRPASTPSDLYFTVTTELGMGSNARTFAVRKSAQPAPVYLYRMEWETPINGGRMRAHHGLEVPLVFDNVANGANMFGEGAAAAQQVADAMSAAWLQFARTGNPNAAGLVYWPPFRPDTQETMVFNVSSHAVSDPVRMIRLLIANPPKR